MKRFRGFKLKRRISTLFRCVVGKRRRSRYDRIDPSERKPRSVTRFFSSIKRKAKAICCAGAGRGYLPLDAGKPDPVPKGRMAVYVGQSDGDFHRFLVPVIYINHPLFGKLLREAEEEFGFDHPGGITIPCQISEFESVQAKIAAGRGCRRLPIRRSMGGHCG